MEKLAMNDENPYHHIIQGKPQMTLMNTNYTLKLEGFKFFSKFSLMLCYAKRRSVCVGPQNLH